MKRTFGLADAWMIAEQLEWPERRADWDRRTDMARNWMMTAAIVAAATLARAESINLVNHSFEADRQRVQLVDRPWTGNIDGWCSDESALDSGVDVLGSALVTRLADGQMYAGLMGTDPEVWQTTAHAISRGEFFTMTFDAYNCWGGPSIVGSLYYVDSAGARVILASTTVNGMAGGIPYVGSLSYLATGEQGELGRVVGIVFDNPSSGRYSWAAFDNIHLDFTNGLAALYPSPADGAEELICRNLPLSWRPGLDGVRHDIYLGLGYDEVADATPTADPTGVYVGRQDPNTLVVPALKAGQTYYWRVDEVAANGTITKGTVWQFDTEPQGYPIPGAAIRTTASSFQAGSGPENTINGSGLDAGDGHSTKVGDMWQTQLGAPEPAFIEYQFDKAYELHEMLVWNYNSDVEYLAGFGLKEVAVQHSMDGENWTDVGNFTFNRGASKAGYKANTAVPFAGAVARYVRLVVNSSWGTWGGHGLSEVRFLYVPTWAREPSPGAGQTNVAIETPLIWRASRDAVSHEVCLGMDQQAVAPGAAPVATTNDNLYQGPPLTLGMTYYWKINEVNAAATPPRWEGDVWSFTTADFIPVDDFEQYTNDSPNRVFQTWRDGSGFSPDEFFPAGYDGNGTGATVGNDPQAGDIMERTLVRTGSTQAMPVLYDNTSLPTSEAVRTFDPAWDRTDWTLGGAGFLVLFFQGAVANTTGRLYVKINDAKVLYDGAAENLTKPFWIRWAVDLTKVNTNLANIKTLAIGVDSGGSGTLLVDDIRLYRVAPPLATEEVWVEAEAADSLVSPMQVYSDQPDARGGHYIATFNDNSSTEPPDNGIAGYTVQLSGGTYRIIGRVIAPTGSSDSFWVRMEGATTNTTNHVSGWVQWGLVDGAAWHETPVRSTDDADQTVLFTVPAGVYNLQIAFREGGALLDAWMITRQAQ